MPIYRVRINPLLVVPGISIINSAISFGFLRTVDLIIFLSYLLYFFKNRHLPRMSIIILFLSLVWLTLSVVGSMISQELSGLEKNLRFFEGFFWIILPFSRDTRIKYGLVFGACLMSFSSLIMFFLHPAYQRFAGFFSSAGGEGLAYQASFNEWGAIFSIVAVAALSQIIIFGKYSYVFPLSIIVAGLYLTQSRSSMLAMLIGLFFLGIYRIYIDISQNRIKRGTYFLIMLPVIFYLAYNFLSKKLALNRFIESFQVGSNAEVSASTRLYMWDTAQGIWLNDTWSILFGVGYQAFQRLMGGGTSDSFYLDHLAIFGICALAVYFAYLIFIVWNANSNRVILVITMLSCLFIAITGNVISDPLVSATMALTLSWLGYGGRDEA